MSIGGVLAVLFMRWLLAFLHTTVITEWSCSNLLFIRILTSAKYFYPKLVFSEASRLIQEVAAQRFKEKTGSQWDWINKKASLVRQDKLVSIKSKENKGPIYAKTRKLDWYQQFRRIIHVGFDRIILITTRTIFVGRRQIQRFCIRSWRLKLTSIICTNSLYYPNIFGAGKLNKLNDLFYVLKWTNYYFVEYICFF